MNFFRSRRMFKYATKLILFLTVVFCLDSCSKEVEVQGLDRNKLDLKFNSTYNTARYKIFCELILNSGEEYYYLPFNFRVSNNLKKFRYNVTTKRNDLNFSKLGLLDGDIVVQVNNVRLDSPKDVRKLYTALKDKSRYILKLIILRNRVESLVEVPFSKTVCANSVLAKLEKQL